MNLLDPLLRWEAVDAVFTDRACLQGILNFEAALARAEGLAGVIPQFTVSTIEEKCRAELFDIGELSRSAALSGNIAIPLIRQLTALVARTDKAAAGFVHWGATSQDAIDTGLVLQLRQALNLISEDLHQLSRALEKLTEAHRATPIAGRTWMQHALPTTFGLKVAGWLDAVERHRGRLGETQNRCLALQFGGAVGSLAALGSRGIEVARNLAKDLGLTLPDVPWHSHRDRMAEVAATLGLCVGTFGKIARDISLHMQTEVAEISEPAVEGRGGSSTMPHKRNPVSSAVILSAAARIPGLVSTMLTAMVQEDERGLGGWQAEWETLPQVVSLTAGALHHLVLILPRLGVDAERMRHNLEISNGLIFAEAVTMALGQKIGRPLAHELIEAACARASREKLQLRSVLGADETITAHLSLSDLDRLFDARQYLGVAESFIDRVLTTSRSAQPKIKS